MFKKLILAVVPVLMATGSVRAEDDLLAAIAKLDNSSAAVASNASVNEEKLGKSDVDALLGDSEKEGEEAIAACFRKIGYGQSYGSYGGYGGYNNYCGYSSYSYCQPYSYSYNCYTPSYTTCYTPVTYTYQAPVTTCYSPCYTSYWGCW